MNKLTYTLLWSFVLMLPHNAIAQTGAVGAAGAATEKQQPAPSDKALAVAPQSAPQSAASKSDAQSTSAAAQPAAAGPANICRELLAFLQSKAGSPQSPATAGQPGP